jgi:EAL domain-containing protein (putative c-di-GMP-specific phosphodiesterase class I)
VIVRSTADLGHNLGLVVLAEGVEDGETWELLRRHGVDLAQGYLISRPVPAAEFMTWLGALDAVPAVAAEV